MTAPLSLPALESHPTQMAVDPAAYQTMTVTADSSMLAMAPILPAPTEETAMPPLVELDDATEIVGSAAEGQGAI